MALLHSSLFFIAAEIAGSYMVKNEKTEISLETIMAILPGHVYWLDRNNVFLGCNDLQAKTIGLSSRHEIVGRTVPEFQAKENAEHILKVNNKVMATGNPEVVEEPYLRSDGKTAIYLSQKVPIKSKGGEVIGLLGISFDISTIKEKEVSLVAARKKTEELCILQHEVAKKIISFTDKITNAMAHELRTPLSVINLEMDLLKLALSANKPQDEKDNIFKQTHEIVKNKIHAAAHVIEDMLIKIRSLASDKMASTFDVISITADINELLSTYPFAGGEKELITLKNFHDVKSGFKYCGDPTLTKHVLASLIKNALSAIKEAGKGIIIFELCMDDAKFNKLIIRDTALGMSQKTVEKIFDQFETRKESNSGMGLGLAFCKMVMETYGGSITCKSKKGTYTEFVLSFPKV